ncbi:hypothetical protein BD779DRAFT_461367 [Infundibulicybe gibba]|nr:hypothetical protein BD779DRAFT_461367 [Infundibulicybe gibba]
MAAAPEKSVQNDPKYEISIAPGNKQYIDELAQAREQIEILKAADPYRVVDMAIEIQVERARAVEALRARDAAIHRLSEAYISLRQKTTTLERVQQERATYSNFATPLPRNGQETENGLRAEISKLENIIKDLNQELRALKASSSTRAISDPPPSYDEGPIKTHGRTEAVQSAPVHSAQAMQINLRLFKPIETNIPAPHPTVEVRQKTVTENIQALLNNKIDGSSEKMKARYQILESIPLPDAPPDDTLRPIIIPPPFTLHEFLANASGSLRSSLSNYRVFQGHTTFWCPEREEHGFFYAPVFKCNTNPRVNTAHRWNAVDVISRMNAPTECFYNKDGTWYYAGIYTAFLLDEMTVKEWAELSPETTQAIIKDTIAGRKNTSPQNMYETSQLYAAGALRVACVGLKCVGFNQSLYKAILEQADKMAQTKWKNLILASAPSTPGIGSAPSWGTGNGPAELTDAIADLNLRSRPSTAGNENIPPARK